MANTKSLDLESSSSQYASITDGSQTGLDITGDISIEAWINLETTGSEQIIVGKWLADGTNQRSYLFWIDSGNKLNFKVSNDGNEPTATTGVSTTSLTIGWHHVAVTYDASAGTCAWYLDGLADGTGSGLETSVYNSSSQFMVGVFESAETLLFDGLIEHVRVWNDIRTEAEIRQYMFQEPSASASGLVSWWKLDNDYTDEHSNGNDLTASGSPVFSDDVQWTDGGNGSVDIEHCVDDDTVALWHLSDLTDETDNNLDLTNNNSVTTTTGFDGTANGAYDFNGTSQYLSHVDDALFTLSSSFSIGAWIKPADISSYDTICGNNKRASTKNGWGLRLSSGNLQFLYSNADTDYITAVTASTYLTNDTWAYVMGVHDADNNIDRLYIDGVLVKEETSRTTDAGDSGEQFRIGARADAAADYFDGVIDEVTISTRTKSAEEIAKYYAGRVSAKFYSGSNDGCVYKNDESSWNTQHDATDGDGADNSLVSQGQAFSSRDDGDGTYQLFRSFFEFDLSGLSSNDVKSATLSIYGVSNSVADVIIQEGTQSASLGTADFDAFTGSSFGENISWITSGYNDFIINSSGITYLDGVIGSGTAKFCGREKSHDYNDSGAPSSQVKSGCYYSEETGTDKDPYLWVEYEASTYLFGVTTGTFTLTGIASDFLYNRLMSAVAGSFTLTGVSSDLLYNRVMEVTKGSFSLTGIDINMGVGYMLDASTGNFTLTGISTDFLHDKILNSDTGAFVFTGINAGSNYNRVMDVIKGTFDLVGKDTGLYHNRVFDVTAGSFTLTGVNADRVMAYIIDATKGEFNLTLNDPVVVSWRKRTEPTTNWTKRGF